MSHLFIKRMIVHFALFSIAPLSVLNEGGGYFPVTGCATCRCVTAALANPDASSLRPPMDPAELFTSPSKLQLEEEKLASLRVCGPSELQMSPHQTAALPTADAPQVRRECQFAPKSL